MYLEFHKDIDEDLKEALELLADYHEVGVYASTTRIYLNNWKRNTPAEFEFLEYQSALIEIGIQVQRKGYFEDENMMYIWLNQDSNDDVYRSIEWKNYEYK